MLCYVTICYICYYLCYICYLKMPFSSFTRLCSLQTKDGLMLGQTYRNDHGFKEFYKHISQVMKDEQAAIIKKTQFLSVLSNGSTDLSVIEEEIVYVRWVSRNHNIL